MVWRFIAWLDRKLFWRWYRVTVTDPEEIARIKEEFGIDAVPKHDPDWDKGVWRG